MVVEFITEDDTGRHKYVGHVVCRGPSSIVLLLTQPFNLAGHTVQFPMSDVVSEEVVSTT